MAQITIEIPDELLPRLEHHQNRLSGVLSRWLTAFETVPAVGSAATPQVSGVYQEILDFLLTQPDPESVLGFKVSTTAQARLSELLERNRVAQLTPSEVAELDLYEQLDQMMRMLKIRAFARLKELGEGSATQVN